MLKFILSGCCLILLCVIADGQGIVPTNEKAYTDSLEHVLSVTQSDSIKARTYYLLSDYWRLKDTVRGKQYLAMAKSSGAKNEFNKALYYYFKGQVYFNFNTDMAAAAFMEASKQLAAFNTNEARKFRSGAYFNYAQMQQGKKGYSFSIDVILNKAIPLMERAGDDEKLGHQYSQLGILFMYNGQFDKAAIYMNKAIVLLQAKYPKSTTLLLAYIGAAANYFYMEKNSEGKSMLDKAKQMLAPYPESINYPYYYNSEALYYTGISAFDKALKSLDMGIALAKKFKQPPMLQMLVFRKYNVFYEMKDYKKAKQFLEDLIKEGLITKDLRNRKTIYDQLAKTDAQLGLMAEAYKWSTAYSSLSDSMSNSKFREDMNALEIKFRNAENQKEITALENDKKQSALAAKNNRLASWLLLALSLFILAVAISAVIYFRNTKKIATQKLKDMEQEQRLTVSKAMIEGEEKERERIARDLHDGLGGMLAGVKINLSSWATNHNAPTPDVELYQIVGQIDRSVHELRMIARNMMPQNLMTLGLEAALKDLCESIITEDIHISFQAIDIDRNIPFPIQIAIYRIVQELLANALKHANAKNMVIQCSQDKNVLFITVEDDGIGFDIDSIKTKAGLGLNNIENRVKYLNGKLEINSTLNEGTSVNIELNIDEQA
ncbi:tetratricopeptide repeat-containing sensor histidine kinase [Mucilaginibacter jinjuensis]|uniref:histidine kinase n=1 Tax=Mucilaginibacter jinjuensis TaxID=1176721 RepID=A0ABY7T1S8_9SPHI|nr:sensor histidine kinase [Mucilaginibacter jinjuensis]WCT10174.1 sensor histidine kinase [Mucilaginibacter jinjuensis]